MSISIEDVEHVAKLTRLKLSDEELKIFQMELNVLLEYFQNFEKLDVLEGSSSHILNIFNKTSSDKIEESVHKDLALRNAPLTRASLFIVPTILGD